MGAERSSLKVRCLATAVVTAAGRDRAVRVVQVIVLVGRRLDVPIALLLRCPNDWLTPLLSARLLTN